LLQTQTQIQKKDAKDRVVEARIKEDAKGNEERDIPTHDERTGMRCGVVEHTGFGLLLGWHMLAEFFPAVGVPAMKFAIFPAADRLMP
jgi:hypothetical protein